MRQPARIVAGSCVWRRAAGGCLLSPVLARFGGPVISQSEDVILRRVPVPADLMITAPLAPPDPAIRGTAGSGPDTSAHVTYFLPITGRTAAGAIKFNNLGQDARIRCGYVTRQ